MYNNIFFTLTAFFLLLTSCSEEGSTIWNKPIGSSVFKGFLGSKNDSKEEEKPQKPKPLISYDALSDNISKDITPSNSFSKIPVGKKLVNGFTGEWYDKNLEPVIKGKSKAVYDNLQGPFPPNISGWIPDGDAEFPPPTPDLPFADLNRNPIITSPFPGLDTIPKAPPTEFFFEEVTRKPPVIGD